jgi:Zn ribbon nucleic-acid-binding protein
MPNGRPRIPIPPDVKCPQCDTAEHLWRRGSRVLWNGEAIPKYFCLACSHTFTTAIIPERVKGISAKDVQVRDEARRGRLVVAIHTKPRILARLVAHCAEIGVANMSAYVEMLCEVRFAELTAPLIFNKPEKTTRRDAYHWSDNRRDAAKNSSTSVALAAIRSKSEAGRIGQMHRTHRSGAAQDQP